jgi:hypothetical protein
MAPGRRVPGVVWIVALAAATLGLLTMPGGAAGAVSGARWGLSVAPYPSTVEPGHPLAGEPDPGVIVTARNVGGAPMHGKMLITSTLPPGLLPSSTRSIEGYIPAVGELVGAAEVICGTEEPTAGQYLVSCSSFAELPPGQVVAIDIPVEVAPSAEGTLTTAAVVEGGGAEAATATGSVAVTSTLASFGFLPGTDGIEASLTDPAGSETSQSGSYPTHFGLTMAFPLLPSGSLGEPFRVPDGGVRSLNITLPKGMVVDPQAASKCREVELTSETCPITSQVGAININVNLFAGVGPRLSRRPIFNMVPTPGAPAVLAFEVSQGIYVHIIGHVRSEAGYELAADIAGIPSKVGFVGAEAELWGIPSQAVHDESREPCLSSFFQGAVGGPFKSCAAERRNVPFLVTPSSCEGPLSTTVLATSWGTGSTVGDSDESLAMEGCGALPFQPTIQSRLSTGAADSPAGLDFAIHVPQAAHVAEGEEPPLATANLKDARVVLPEGVSLNPAAANGLGSCEESQIGFLGGGLHFSENSQTCPSAAKVGTVAVTTPLLDHQLPGAIYVAKPFANPFGSLLAIYLAVEDEKTGIIAKLAGKVEPDPRTGQLTATFTENPQLPLEDIDLEFFSGARGVLTTPLTCGAHATTSTLTPWTTPEGVDAHPSDSFQTTVGCSASEATAPKTVAFTAGTQSPLSGAYSPFTLRLSRPDGSQHITGVETTLPEGLLGKLAGVAYCPESGIAQAISREHPEGGKTEQQSPSCPSSSEVGTVNVTAGSGISPVPVSGHAYLAGPYKGAPLSLVVIVPAVAGPFDLGTVVDRVALNVGEYDARIHAVADPLPTIREGIPLDVRSIELKLDRPNFTLNPTSCEAKAIEGSVSTQAGQSAALNNRFQVGECGRLAFKPKIAISLKGPTKRTGLPALKATVSYPQAGAYANIARAQVSLPSSEFLEQGNIGLACTKPVLQAHACPAKSVYGKAKAWSPLLAQPLEGPVYLVGGYGYKLPAMVAELDGQIRVLLVGKVDTGSTGGIRNTFEAVPDAPVEKFTLELKGGKKYGLLVNSENICKKKQVGQASFTAQNGKVLNLKPTIANSCGKSGKKGDGKGGKHKKGGGKSKGKKQSPKTKR